MLWDMRAWARGFIKLGEDPEPITKTNDLLASWVN
jgi:hypothetical protein